ncbi:hypothetical protein [Roseisolibacter agri]|uniref:Uncharacterized protein n=1 Tax=Roseisolibacter agri TaxID=2014610 RepID=A0AA37QGD9_9BACT|nr:hypothetical protein [Roseisolibacter agri]GLC25920.1 hypothetical protein rosag_24330 [Roseisolibacter agri]
MRQYQYLATDATIDALGRLRRPWAGYHVGDDTLLVALAEGGTIRIGVEGADVEPDFEAFRLTAEAVDGIVDEPTAAQAFGTGRNDVVVFRSATWIEGPAPSDDGVTGTQRVMQFTGAPRQLSPSAAAACAVDDACVVATSAGTGMLVRCGVRPRTLDVTLDSAAIAQFLRERQYGAEPSGS